MIKPTRQAMDWVMATLVVAMLPQMASMPPHLILICLAPIAWRVAAEARNWKPPNVFIRVVLAVTGVGLLFATYGGLFGRRAAVSLLAVMLSLKLVEAWRLRDARVVVTTALFLSSTQFLFSQGLGMLIYGAAVLSCALVAMIHLQRAETFAPEHQPPRVHGSFTGEIGYSARLLVLAVPMAIALFALFPRWSTPMWGVPEDALDARTGLSESMSPGSIQNLYMDDSPAFRVEFDGPIPQNHQLYWRGPVFWEFDGRTWSGSYKGDIKARDRSLPAEAEWFYTVQLEPTEQRWLFALDYPAVEPAGTTLTLDYQIYTESPITSLREYRMASDPGFIDTPSLGREFRTFALTYPRDFNPRTQALVSQWRDEFASDVELIQNVLRHFREEEFHYTINPPLLGRDTVDEFMFDTRSGFCEHYASSFALMMRMAGIPSRIVTGYQGGYYSDFGGYFLVRQSDAHAWVEVWLEELGWTRIDPTAAVSPFRVERGALEALEGRRHWLDFDWIIGARNLFDLAQRGWNDKIIAFSALEQRRLLSPLGLDQFGPAGLVAMLMIIIGLLAAVLYPLLRRLDAGKPADPSVRQWRRFIKKLRRAGLDVQPGDAPLEIAWRAISTWPQDAEDIRWITSNFIKCRYEPEPPDYLVIVLRRAVSRYRPGRGALQPEPAMA